MRRAEVICPGVGSKPAEQNNQHCIGLYTGYVYTFIMTALVAEQRPVSSVES